MTEKSCGTCDYFTKDYKNTTCGACWWATKNPVPVIALGEKIVLVGPRRTLPKKKYLR